MRAEEHTLVVPYASVEAIEGGDGVGGARSVLVEAKLVWGGETLAIAHVRCGRVLRVSDLGFDVGGGELVVARRTRGRSGRVALALPNGRLVPPGSRVTLRLGRAALRLELVADDVAAPPRPRADGRLALGLTAAALLHASVVGALAYGRASDASIEEGHRAELQRYMMAAEARTQRELAKAFDAKDEDALAVPSSGAAPVKGERGMAGNPTRAEADRQRRITRGVEARALRPAHDEVASFGLVGLLSGDGARAGTSAFAADVGRSAMGNIFGTSIGDAVGFGAVDLSGTGEGGGGTFAGGLGLSGVGGGSAGGALGIGLGTIGTLGHGTGTVSHTAYGVGHGRLVGEHKVGTVSCRCGETSVSGRLPPEAVQRVVRESFGRFRLCYEQGLRRDPGLEGRISVKFVIGRSGAVEMASVADRSLADASVAGCVARAFEQLSFPEPTGGIVTVVYPIVFSKS